jgi:aryl-alcohol dehydrogenase-like predicted oxidoreductase
MEHRHLGHAGMYVSPLCLGAMTFGAWGERNHGESVAIVHKALDAGINFIDTADVYSRASRRSASARRPRGGATTSSWRQNSHGPMDVAMGQPGGDPNKRGNLRRWIVQEVETA